MRYKEIEVPNFEIIDFKNIYSGSFRNINYKIFPDKETVKVVIWEGMNCLDESEISEEKEFIWGREGYNEMIEYIYSQLVRY